LAIPGFPNVQKVDIVYVLNDLQTEIDRIAVTARNNNARLWSYDIEGIEDYHVALVLPLAQPIAPTEGGDVVRLSIKSDPKTSSRNNNNG